MRQAADDQPQEKVRQIACTDRCAWKRTWSSPTIPVDDHADKREERNAAQLGQSKLRQYAAFCVVRLVRLLVN